MTNADNFTLRAMTPDDLTSVLAIEAQSQFHPWSHAEFERSLKPNRRAWLMEDAISGDIAAFAVFGLLAGECELLTIATAPNYRRKGLAKALINHALTDLNPESIFLEVRESNTQAIELYESLGFNEIGCRKNYYPTANNQRENALLYAFSRF